MKLIQNIHIYHRHFTCSFMVFLSSRIAIDFWQCYIMMRYESNQFEISQTKDFCKLKQPMRLKISLDSLTFWSFHKKKIKAQQKFQKWTMKNWYDLWAHKLLFFLWYQSLFFSLWFEISKWIYPSLMLNVL